MNNGGISTKLQVSTTRRENTVYEKFQAVFPTSLIVDCGWQKGDELEFDRDRKGRIVVSAHPSTRKSQKPEENYEMIKLAVWSILNSNPYGLTWTEIREKSSILPKKPSPFLVARLEADIGLVRTIEEKTRRKMWMIPDRYSDEKPNLDRDEPLESHF